MYVLGRKFLLLHSFSTLYVLFLVVNCQKNLKRQKIVWLRAFVLNIIHIAMLFFATYLSSLSKNDDAF